MQKVWKTLPKCLYWVLWKDARCFQWKTKTVPKSELNCLRLLAFRCNLQDAKDVKDENSMLRVSPRTKSSLRRKPSFCFGTEGF